MRIPDEISSQEECSLSTAKTWLQKEFSIVEECSLFTALRRLPNVTSALEECSLPIPLKRLPKEISTIEARSSFFFFFFCSFSFPAFNRMSSEGIALSCSFTITCLFVSPSVRHLRLERESDRYDFILPSTWRMLSHWSWSVCLFRKTLKTEPRLDKFGQQQPTPSEIKSRYRHEHPVFFRDMSSQQWYPPSNRPQHPDPPAVRIF